MSTREARRLAFPRNGGCNVGVPTPPRHDHRGGPPGKRGNNVLISRAGRDRARRLLVGSTMAIGLGVFGLGLCSLCALAGEDASTAGPLVPESNAGSPNITPFLGDPELKARLDVPGKLVVAGERMHEQLLRRFYTVHGYQPVWTSRTAEASHLWNAILHAGNQGLDPGLFHSSVIAERGQTLSPVERDLLLSDAFLSYADALSRGALPIEDRADDEDLTPEPVDIVEVLDAAIASPNPAQLIEALAPSTPAYLALRRAYAENRAVYEGGISMRSSDARKKPERGASESRSAAERRMRQLAVNLERLRWLPRRIAADRVEVNAAIARLR